MKLTPITRQAAVEYRKARDAYFGMDPDANDGYELDVAEAAYEHAAKVLAELMLFEIDHVKEGS